MAFSMADYLSTGVADYTATELSVTPQDILPVNPVKNQLMLWTDAEAPHVINIDDDSVFTVNLSFKYISDADAKTIMDFWITDSIANGKENTFYWVHPTDGETYVARFVSYPSNNQYPGVLAYQGITNVKLFISAKKA